MGYFETIYDMDKDPKITKVYLKPPLNIEERDNIEEYYSFVTEVRGDEIIKRYITLKKVRGKII